jgi:formiminotetrahydrofolate cyclodeaminase
MSDSRFSDMTLDGFLGELASDAATPGGGAVAALSAAAGAALIAMTARLTVGRKGFEDLEERMQAMLTRADEERASLLRLADEDAVAFEQVMAAYRMPRETDEQKAERAEEIQRATKGAAAVPLKIAQRAVDLMELAEDAAALGNPNASSDGYCAAAMLFSAAVGAIANVRINAVALKDHDTSEALIGEITGLRARADQLLQEAQEAFLLRLSA